MKKKLLILFLALFTILINGQNKIKGQLIDSYGETTIAEIKVNNGELQIDFDSGKFEIKTDNNSIIEIEFIYFGDFKLKYIIENNSKIIDLGKIHLIESNNWFDGPKNGHIKGKYDSGIIKYNREIRNWKLNGVSEFYNKKGELTQKVIFKKNIPIEIYIRNDNGEMKEFKFEFDKKTWTLTVPNNS